MRFNVKNIALAAALAGAAFMGTEAANALPIAPDAGPASTGVHVEKAAYPCGPGWHLNRWGHCVRWGYYGRPYYYGGPYYGYRYGYWRRPYWRHRYYHPYWGHRYWHRRYWR